MRNSQILENTSLTPGVFFTQNILPFFPIYISPLFIVVYINYMLNIYCISSYWSCGACYKYLILLNLRYENQGGVNIYPPILNIGVRKLIKNMQLKEKRTL